MDVPEIECGEALVMRDAGATWIDVREPSEWHDAHIEGTLLLPLEQAAAELPVRYPDTSTQLVISCATGVRSAHLVAYLRTRGYLDVHNLRGGIRAWAREGRAVVTDSPDARPVC